MCVRACVCVCVRACVRVCAGGQAGARVRVRACVDVWMCGCAGEGEGLCRILQLFVIDFQSKYCGFNSRQVWPHHLSSLSLCPGW